MSEREKVEGIVLTYEPVGEYLTGGIRTRLVVRRRSEVVYRAVVRLLSEVLLDSSDVFVSDSIGCRRIV